MQRVAATVREASGRLGGEGPIHLLFSAHGVPLSFVRRGDPYPDHVRQSARHVVEALGWTDPWHLSWQSRLGPVKWLRPATAEWNAAVDAELAKQRQAAAARLWPEIPQRRYLCFYPMNKYRGEQKNWYSESINDRQRMMRDHGMIGRHYAGRVTQIISGSIGFADWEWGVDLFADDPLVFKKLVYEMRFDEASAVYGLFGAFFIAMRFPAAQLGTLLDGKMPGLS